MYQRNRFLKFPSFQNQTENYRRTNQDCAEALKLNPKNVKAWYRSARACFALDKIAEARDCIHRGLDIDESNAALKALSEKVEKRAAYVKQVEDDRKERERVKRAKETALRIALKVCPLYYHVTRSFWFHC